jgi:Ca2+-binding EF-hand superfamily protein
MPLTLYFLLLQIINATRLQADISYDVQCEDKREDALNSLSKEEMESIKETFQRYDINGDGGISRPEMEELVRIRTADRIAIINEKFKAYCAESSESEGGLSEEELVNAQNNKAQYLQQMEEAQSRLLKMFDAADTNGDGIISFTEFIMSEAWWLRCTINPDKAHLF